MCNVLLEGSANRQEGRFVNIAANVGAHFPPWLPGGETTEGSGKISSEREFITSIKPIPWPKWIESTAFPGPPQRVTEGVHLTHINHATFLIQVQGINLLTDPIWSDRASPLSWVGPRRVRAPGLALEDLPPIDAVLISHNHYDHLDIPTLKALDAQFGPLFVVGLGNKTLLESEGIKSVVELDWWQSHEVDALPIRFVPAQHGSGRGIFDRNKTLWGGFVLESAGVGNIYFAGDTGLGPFATHIKQRYSEIFLAMLPVGHYLPREMMREVHLSPSDAADLHQYLGARNSVGMHFGTFHGFGAHNAEGVNQHETDLCSALTSRGITREQFLLLDFGEGRRFSTLASSSPGKPMACAY